MTDSTGDGAPKFRGDAFRCPHCRAFSQQLWFKVHQERADLMTASLLENKNLWVSECARCREEAVWREGLMTYPTAKTGEPPHEDMPDDVRSLYEEARTVGSLSKKSAAALIRLALQTLVDELEPGSLDVNKKIGKLVARGLDEQVQQAMDVLRVMGNNAVHPGQIDLDEDDDLLPSLFALVNLIVEQLISRPKRVRGLFGALPKSAREAIAKRDSQTKGQIP